MISEATTNRRSSPNPQGQDGVVNLRDSSTINPFASSVHSMPSFTLFEGNQDEDDYEHGVVKSSDQSTGYNDKSNKCCMVPTVIAVALVISLGVITLGFVGFLPIHLIGFQAVSKTAELIQLEAVRGVILLMRSTILRLPDIAYTITANYILNQTSAYEIDALPSSSESVMYSLLSVLSTFRETISSFKFAHTGKLYGLAKEPQWNPPGSDLLLGGHSTVPASTPLFYYQATTLEVASTEPFSYWDIPRDVSMPEGAFKSIVDPWEKHGSSKQWLPESRFRTGLYFNFVIPFRVHDASGYCEVGMSIDRLLREAQPLIAALRDYGRVMLFDSKEKVVILNSWGENVTKWVGNFSHPMQYEFLSFSKIKDPLAATIAAQLLANNKRVLAITENTEEFIFPFAGSSVRVSVARLTDKNGLNVMLAVAVLHSDFFSGIVRVRTIILSVVVAIVVLSAALAFVGACYLVRPLYHLVSALKRASNLELSGSDRKRIRRSRILEVEEIQSDYLKLLRQLLVLRKFVPEAILARVDAPYDSTFDNSAALGLNDGLRSTLFFYRDEPHAHRSVTRAYKCDVRLNSNIFREQLNLFSPKYCTIVAIEVHSPEFFGDSPKFMSLLVATAAEHMGCVEVLGPERGVVSFGAHSPLPMHSSKGCMFAFDFFMSLTPQEQAAVAIVLDSSEFFVGTCGARARNARVLFGTLYVFELTKAISGAQCSIAATSGTASQLQDVQVFPIDCVLLSCSPVPVVLSELRQQKSTSQKIASANKHFRLGFAAMRQGYYKQAMAHYQRVGKSDPQAHRLIKLCAQRCLNRDTTPYVRETGDVYDIGSHFAPPEEGTTRTGDTLLEAHEFKNTLPHKGNARADNPNEAQNSAAKEDSGALFEMYQPSSSTEFDYDEVENNSGTDDMPLQLTDINKRVWTRSLKKISEGAYSSVFLGMSEDGVQVAIKCIPRRRRDIMPESLEAEMNIASKLRHPNAVQYVSCSVMPSHLAIIMEYLPGGSVYVVIKSFGSLSPRMARRFTVDILNGLNYLHGLGVVHCDVKPHNVLLGMDGVCKLSDFGSTITEAADMVRQGEDDVVLRGTALYMSPEVAAGGRCTAQSDIYSLGITLLEMLLGRSPWRWSSTAPDGSDANGLRTLLNRDALFVRSLARGYLEPEIPESLDHEAAIFVRSCCSIDPAARPTALELLSYAFVL